MIQEYWLNPFLYRDVYVWTVVILSVVLIFKYLSATDRAIFYGSSLSVRYTKFLTIALILFLGTRPISGFAFGDMGTYFRGFIMETANPSPFGIDLSKEFGWSFLEDLVHYSLPTLNIRNQFLVFSFIVALGYFGLMAISCIRLDRKHSYMLFMFLLMQFTCYAYCVNGMRNGLGLSINMLALTFLKPGIKNIIFAALLSIFAYSIHHSCALPALCMFIAYFIVKGPKAALGIWLFSILLSLTVGPQLENFLMSFGFDDRLESYIQAQNDTAVMQHYFSKTGFRWDFLAYSIVPIIVGWISLTNDKFRDKKYILLYNTYVLANALWIIVIRAAYSNRFAQLSWFLYGLVLAYPLLNIKAFNNQGAVISIVILVQLGFLILF